MGGRGEGEKGRCCWLGRKEGCRMSCNTGSTGSVGSWGRKDSPAKGNPRAVSGEDCPGWPGEGPPGPLVFCRSIPVPPPLQ